MLHRAAQAYSYGMARPGYQAVALVPAQADKLRQLARYLSVLQGRRVTLSEALEHVIDQWSAEHVHPGSAAVEALNDYLHTVRDRNDHA